MFLFGIAAILVFSFAGAGFVLTRVPPSPVSIDNTKSVIPSQFLVDLGMVSPCTDPASPVEISSANFSHIPNKIEVVDATIAMPPPSTPVANRIHSLNKPSAWKHDDSNVSPVLEWDDPFEESLTSIDLSPLVHLSLEEFMDVPSLPSTPVHCIERDVDDWVHHTPTKVFVSLPPPHKHTNPPHIERLPIIVTQFSLRKHDVPPSLIVHKRFLLFNSSLPTTKEMSLRV